MKSAIYSMPRKLDKAGVLKNCGRRKIFRGAALLKDELW